MTAQAPPEQQPFLTLRDEIAKRFNESADNMAENFKRFVVPKIDEGFEKSIQTLSKWVGPTTEQFKKSIENISKPQSDTGKQVTESLTKGTDKSITESLTKGTDKSFDTKSLASSFGEEIIPEIKQGFSQLVNSVTREFTNILGEEINKMWGMVKDSVMSVYNIVTRTFRILFRRRATPQRGTTEWFAKEQADATKDLTKTLTKKGSGYVHDIYVESKLISLTDTLKGFFEKDLTKQEQQAEKLDSMVSHFDDEKKRMARTSEKDDDKGWIILGGLLMALGYAVGAITALAGGLLYAILLPFQITLKIFTFIHTQMMKVIIPLQKILVPFTNVFTRIFAFMRSFLVISKSLTVIQSVLRPFVSMFRFMGETISFLFRTVRGFVNLGTIMAKYFADMAKGVGRFLPFVGRMARFIPFVGWFIVALQGIFDFFKSFKLTEGPLIEKIKEGLISVFTGFFDPVIRFFGWIADKILSLFGIEDANTAKYVLENFEKGLRWFFDTIIGHFTNMWNIVKSVANIFTNVFQFWKNIFTGNWTKSGENFLNLISGLRDLVNNVFKYITWPFKRFIIEPLQKLWKWFTGTPDHSYIDETISTIYKTVQTVFNVISWPFKTFIIKPIKAITSWLKGLTPGTEIDETREVLQRVWEAIKTVFKMILAPLKLIEKSVGSIISGAKNVVGGVVEGTGKVIGGAKNIAGSTMEGVKNITGSAREGLSKINPFSKDKSELKEQMSEHRKIQEMSDMNLQESFISQANNMGTYISNLSENLSGLFRNTNAILTDIYKTLYHFTTVTFLMWEKKWEEMSIIKIAASMGLVNLVDEKGKKWTPFDLEIPMPESNGEKISNLESNKTKVHVENEKDKRNDIISLNKSMENSTKEQRKTGDSINNTLISNQSSAVQQNAPTSDNESPDEIENIGILFFNKSNLGAAF